MAWADEMVGSDVSSAGLHISECISRDVSSQLDLEEAIEASRYSSYPYASHPKEWPPVAEVVGTRELPSELIERYSSAGGEGTALCGIFPEIRRAWASVDNSLFLWRFDKWDGQCPEYNAEEQAICAVGLARTKAGVFVEAIQYLLVLATPVELILVGLCFTSGGNEADCFAEVLLQPLPEYTIPSDGVTMTCITCTDKGHIFLAGRDGHIYEMQYTSGSGWHKHCRKVCLTSGLGSLISRWIVPNAFNFGAVDPIIDMVVDNERHILYAKTEGMKLQAFDLGQNGDGPHRKFAEEKNLIDPREAQYGGRRSAASRSMARAARPSIVCIAPLSSVESKWLHVVAILSDGRRLYLSTTSSGGGNSIVGSFPGSENAIRRPCCLKVVASRPSPPPSISGGVTFGSIDNVGRTQPQDLNLKVEAAFYSPGTLVLSDSSFSAMSSLLLINKDSNMQPSMTGNLGISSRGSRALREVVSTLPIEGRMLFVADVLPQADTTAAVHSLYFDSEAWNHKSPQVVGRLWAKGDIPMQHILPRKRSIVFSTMGMVDVIFNRPVDILKRLLESNAQRSYLEDFYNRFGIGEAAAMCLMLAARILHSEENTISNIVAEKAAEAFEDPRLVGMPQLNGTSALSSARTPGGFNMGQVVQEAEPIFSGAYDGLCLCSSRLVYPIWEFPIMVRHGSPNGVIVCRLSSMAIEVLETKVRSLELFLRSRRDQRRGLYGYVANAGDFTGSILYGNGSGLSTAKLGFEKNLFSTRSYADGPDDQLSADKRQRLRYTTAELAALEVRAMECLRRMLRRTGEALFLLRLLSQHNLARIVHSLNSHLQHKLLQLTFHQLVCSDEGDQMALRLISELMHYYIGPDGHGTIDEISAKLRDGCPSYFNESDYKYFLAVECLERASLSTVPEERENLSREAFNYLNNFPVSADLRGVCKRFEDLRFYEAVVWLPLQKAQSFSPNGDSTDGSVGSDGDGNSRVQKEQFYAIIADALRSLKVVQGNGREQKELGSPFRAGSSLDAAARDKYISQIVQLSVKWPDKLFHEYLYRTMIELGLEKELLEYGGPDLVSFLQSAGREPANEAPSALYPVESPMSNNKAKYLDLLARYYVMKRQHLLAAHVLYLLAERQNVDGGFTLEQRCQYLSNAVLQAKSATSSSSQLSANKSVSDDGLLDMLEAKLAVLRFQIKIKDGLESLAAYLESSSGASRPSSNDPSPGHNIVSDATTIEAARTKAKELSMNLKSITQLYNEYAVPFQLWEICLEMLNFANYSGDADSKVVRETWLRLIDKALSGGGIAEACLVLKRVGSALYPGDGVSIPLSALCLHLEKAAHERLSTGVELVGDEDVPRALLAACRGAAEVVLHVYDQLLLNAVVLPSPDQRLRILRSILTVLREWSTSLETQTSRANNIGAAYVLGRSYTGNDTSSLKQGVRDKITSAANRYMTEVRRLALPQSQTETVYMGFKEIEERIMRPFSF